MIISTHIPGLADILLSHFLEPFLKDLGYLRKLSQSCNLIWKFYANSVHFLQDPLSILLLLESQSLVMHLVLKLVEVIYNVWVIDELFQECFLVI